jgi:hypothetical protein
VVPPESLLSPVAVFHPIDCTTVTDQALDFTSPFSLSATAAGELSCLVVSFDTIFDCTPAGGKRSAFATSCEGTPTHWKQSVLYLKERVQLAVGGTVAGHIAFKRGVDYKRAYDITATYTVNGGPRRIQAWAIE